MNRPFKLAVLMAIAIMLGLSLPGTVLGADSAEAGGYPMAVTDSAGREVTIPMPVERVIVLNTDAAEAVTILGASNTIVGLAEGIKETYEFYGLKNRPSVGTWNEIDYEMIGEIAYDGSQVMTPDIIVVGYVYPGKPNGVEAVSTNLESIDGISVLGLDFYKEENLSRELLLLGLILGKEDLAKDVLDWHDERASEVESAVADLDHPRVYLESGSSTGAGELTTFGAQSGSAMLLEKAGGENVVKEDLAYPKVDWEWVVSQNPDVIIKTDYLKASDGLPGWSASSPEDSDELETKLDELLSRPGAEEISAVKNGRVYIVKAQSLFGMDSVFGLQLLAEILHPGIELDADEVYEEYLEFMGLGEEEGRIFVYPEV
jgi:iron complex transport system substrate-binding protein